MMFRHGPPARLAAMIDWELSTIGDPMIDLGWFTGGDARRGLPGRRTSRPRCSDPNQWPTRQELARYYCAGTGRDIRDFDYFSILAKFKSGCLLEYKVAAAEAGHLPKETGRFFARIVSSVFEEPTDRRRSCAALGLDRRTWRSQRACSKARRQRPEFRERVS